MPDVDIIVLTVLCTAHLVCVPVTSTARTTLTTSRTVTATTEVTTGSSKSVAPVQATGCSLMFMPHINQKTSTVEANAIGAYTQSCCRYAELTISFPSDRPMRDQSG